MKGYDPKSIMVVLKKPKDLEAERSFSGDMASADTCLTKG